MPVFLVIIAVRPLGRHLHDQLSSSWRSTENGPLRTSPAPTTGDEIYFRQRIPWISGEMNQMQGRIHIRFAVRGTRHWPL